MLKHAKLVEWENTMKTMFDEIDDFLEDKYGRLFPLHPNRMERGETANKESDGLFNVGAAFSAGFGSRLGRGYVIQIHMSTLAHVPEELREIIKKETADLVRNKLTVYFPGRELNVEKDGNVYKIYGDLSLGTL